MLPKAPTKLGKLLKEWRLDKGLTQAKMAALIGVSRGTVANIEAGKAISDLTQRQLEKSLAKIPDLHVAA